MAKEGCDLNGNGYPYPYVLLTKDGTDLEDEKEYTVVICGFSKGMEDELNQQDTGIFRRRRSGRNFKLKKSGRVFIMDGKNKTERQCRYA